MNLRLCLLLASLCAIGHAGAATGMSEQDYFTELPEVLTVTRLAQPISETPGAVTIIDRETIRRSGARELVDVLRLVPGYLVAGFNGANPTAAYHAPIDEFGSRNLVLIDGRPVYSAYYLGDTHRSMMGLALEDIERIEVLRGANSAAYGANAMFGVINIITRHTVDTQGGEVSVTGGEGGINDNYARIGWGGENASFRLSAARRSDSGYLNVYDNKILSQVHFRGDLRPAADQELMLAAGVAQLSYGDGFAADISNLLRTALWRDVYLHGAWQRQLSATDQIKLTVNFDEETFRDSFVHPLGVTVSSSGRGRRTNLEFQHQTALAAQLRAVWGGGYKSEEAVSPPLYYGRNSVAIHEERLFGNLEWRPHPQWLINAGGFWGKHSWTGGYFTPRLMANFHVMPDHTLRAGVTESARIPTLFELAGDVRYYNSSGTLLGHTYQASGSAGPEKLFAQELGYFGNYRDLRLTLDVRAFDERMQGRIGTRGNPPRDFVNTNSLKMRGVEYQLRWKPMEATEIWLNQSSLRLIWDDGWTHKQPPTHATTVALFQRLPGGLDLGLMYHSVGAMSWSDQTDRLGSRRRIDARLAWPFRLGATRAEAALTVQAANGDYAESIPSKNMTFERRAFGTLRLEF